MKNKGWEKSYASAYLNFGEIRSKKYFWFINLAIKPVEGMNFDAVWEEGKMARAHTWSGIKIVWKGMEWIAQRDGLQIVASLHHYWALSSLSAEPQWKWPHKLQVRKEEWS